MLKTLSNPLLSKLLFNLVLLQENKDQKDFEEEVDSREDITEEEVITEVDLEVEEDIEDPTLDITIDMRATMEIDIKPADNKDKIDRAIQLTIVSLDPIKTNSHNKTTIKEEVREELEDHHIKQAQLLASEATKEEKAGTIEDKIKETSIEEFEILSTEGTDKTEEQEDLKDTMKEIVIDL